MSSYIKPVIIVGLAISEIEKEEDELGNFYSLTEAFYDGKTNVCFSLYNQEFEEEYRDAIFGLKIIENNFKGIEIKEKDFLDEKRIKALKEHFKNKIGQDAKIYASYERY